MCEIGGIGHGQRHEMKGVFLDDALELSFRLTKAPSGGGADCRCKGNVRIDGRRLIYKVFKMALESPLGPDERDCPKVKIGKLFSAAALLTSFGDTRLSTSFPLLHHRGCSYNDETTLQLALESSC